MKLFKGWFLKKKTSEEFDDASVEESYDGENEGGVLKDSDIVVSIEPGILSEQDFEIKASDAEGVEEEKEILNYLELPPYDPTADLINYEFPGLELLENYETINGEGSLSQLEANKNIIVSTLKSFGISIQKINATAGPAITLYEVFPSPGVRIAKIKSLKGEITVALSAIEVNIEPIPAKGTIGIEVYNSTRSILGLRSLFCSEKFTKCNFDLPLALGKKMDNEDFIVDLIEFPHLLVCGSTGQGKSSCIDSIVTSLLYKKHPSQLKFLLINPSSTQLNVYRHIEKHFLAKIPGTEEAVITQTKDVIYTLNALCIELDNRHDLLKEAGARSVSEYNDKFIRRRLNPQKGHQYLPFIVLVFDAFQEPEITSMREVGVPLERVVKFGRQVGIHAVIATERPTVNILPPDIASNCTVRIAFKVPSSRDSNIILGEPGAERLIGKGDMLISYNGAVTHLQGAFIDTLEVERVVDFISDQRGYPQAFMLPEYIDEEELELRDFDAADRDPLFEDAARLIVQNQIGSTSLLQRRMKLGYNRSGRLMDQLEAAGIVGPNQGSKAREVLFKTEKELEEYLETL